MDRTRRQPGDLLNALDYLLGGFQIASKFVIAGEVHKLCCFLENTAQGISKDFFFIYLFLKF